MDISRVLIQVEKQLVFTIFFRASVSKLLSRTHVKAGSRVRARSYRECRSPQTMVDFRITWTLQMST